ncbi:MAG: hypothetical protein LUF01_14350 [Bacteroides sp.]|nr:hypothetical protein [Bacteroides sp.]
MNLNHLRDRSYKCACEHGFHDEELSNEHLLCLVISELMEAVEADRTGYHANKDEFEVWIDGQDGSDEAFTHAFEKYLKDTISDELSDTVIRLLDLAGLRNISIESYPIELIPNAALTEHCFYLCKVLSDGGRHSNIDWLKGIVDCVVSYLIELAWSMDVDLPWHIEQKQKHNEFQPKLHGKKY